jgi:hypothetical protein
MKGACGHNPYADSAFLATRCAPRRFEGPIKLRENRAPMGEKCVTRVGELNAARLAAKKLHIEFAFDRLDALAERRLLHSQPFRGARDVALLGDCNEVAEMPELHCHISKDMNFVFSIL